MKQKRYAVMTVKNIIDPRLTDAHYLMRKL